MRAIPADILPTAFTRKQAFECDVTLAILRAAVASGELRRPFRNVYIRAEVADTLAERAAALALTLPPFVAVCDRTAAWLHGVDALRFRELGTPPDVDVVSLRDLTPLRRKGVKGGQRDLDPLDLMTVHDVRTTTPLRTALDLGCKLPRALALGTLDQFMHLHSLQLDDFDAELPRFRGRRGVVQLRQLIRWADGKAESPGESWTRFAILDAGLPTPDVQYSIVVDGAERYRLDLAYPYHRIAIEYDGEQFHSSPEQRAADQRRREWLAAKGWTVLVVTKDDLSEEAIRRWIAELRAALT